MVTSRSQLYHSYNTSRSHVCHKKVTSRSQVCHFDEEDEPKLVMIQGKNKEFLVARRKLLDVLRTASFHRGFKEINNTSFKVTDFANKQYSTECDVEVKCSEEKGKAKVTIYKDNKKKEGKKEQTLMITKKSKNKSVHVKNVTSLMQYLLEGFMKKDIKDVDVVIAVKSNDCDKCERKFPTEQGLNFHKAKTHEEKKEVNMVTYDCTQCEGKFKLQALLNSHIMKTHHVETADVEMEAGIKRQHSSSPGTIKRKKKKGEDTSELKMLNDKFNAYKKEVEHKYSVLIEENRKIKTELEKLQIEKALLDSKKEAETKLNVCSEEKIDVDNFEVDVNVTTEEEIVLDNIEVDVTAGVKQEEAVKVKDGVDDITNVLTSLKLSKMMSVGGRRTSPTALPEMQKNKWYPCTLCNFHSNVESARDWHVQNVHNDAAPCPLCNNRFSDLRSLKEHITLSHKENDVQTKKVTKTRLCAFFQTERGCKKEDECDFSHDITSCDNNITKINKLCRHGLTCFWKPRCKFIHPEDGEVLTPRGERWRRSSNHGNREPIGSGFGIPPLPLAAWWGPWWA